MMRELRLGAILTIALLGGCASPRYQGLMPLGAVRAQHDLRTCTQVTGSHIDAPQPRCVGVGHSYSRDMIQSNGAVDVEHALQDLDLAITVAPARARLRVR